MEEVKKKFFSLFGRYKYVLLVAAAGILLLLWPSGGGADDPPAVAERPAEETFSVDALEHRLEEALSSIQGVGRTRVLLTLKNDMEVLLSKDERESQHREMEDGNLSSYDYESEATIVMKNGAEGDSPLVVGRVYPEFLGALVVCEGANDKAVQLQVVEAVSSLIGLGADKITVAVMKKNDSQ